MSDSLETQPQVFGGKAAALLGGIFLGAFVLCAVLVSVDRSHRARLETIQPQAPAVQPAR